MSSLRWPVILFDLDGTLVDTINLIVSSFQHTWRLVLGEELSAQQAKLWIGRTLGDITSPYSPELAQQLSETYLKHNRKELPNLQQNYAGVDQLLIQLKNVGAEIGIVTSKRKLIAAQSLVVAGLDTRIKLLATLNDTMQHKPNPAPLDFALNKLRRSPSETVYVGDAVVDVQAAKAANMSAIAVTWGAGSKADLAAEQPDALVETVAELTQVLLNS